VIAKESDASGMKVWVIPPGKSPGTVKGRKETMNSRYSSEISCSI
jgi:hypothetical protein